MPKKYRLSRADFMNMRGFKRLNGAVFSLSYGKIVGRTNPGAAVVVSSKVAGKAVDRNRIKRRARSFFAHTVKELPSQLVLVAIAKKGAHAVSFETAHEDLKDLVIRATRGL